MQTCRSACPVLLASGISGDGIDAIRSYAVGNRTLTFLGASGVGKSTLVNALVGDERQATSAVREGDQRGRHTTVAAELVPLPGEGWLIDTPGVRALSLWLSGHGIERAFADVFDLMDHCRFRDCKHDQEPGCAVQAAIADGTLDPVRLHSLERLIEEEAALEEEQRAHDKAADRRAGGRRGRPRNPSSTIFERARTCNDRIGGQRAGPERQAIRVRVGLPPTPAASNGWSGGSAWSTPA